MAVNSDFIDRRGRQGMSHNHETHDLAGDGPPGQTVTPSVVAGPL